MSRRVDRLLQSKRQAILVLTAKHGAHNVRVFGSAARGTMKPASDVDFLVDLAPGRSLVDLGALNMDLRDLLGREVDVATQKMLHWYIRERVLREAVPL